MVDEGERPKSSWQSWVRSTERRTGGAHRSGNAVPAADDADLDVVRPWEPTDGDTADAALSSDLSFDPIDGPLTPSTTRRPSVGAEGAEPIDGAEEPIAPGPPSDDDADGSWTTWPDDAGRSDADANDEPEVLVDAGNDVDDGYDDDDEDEDEDDSEEETYGELLPTVPLLPSIAGRVEALSGVLRSISHRVDGLSATTDVYRSTMVDRIDQFTETVLEQGRHADQALDEYRRTTERTIAELRRRLGEQGDTASTLLARVEEIATDLGSLLQAPGSASAPTVAPALLAELAELRTLITDASAPVPAPTPAAPVSLAGVESSLEVLEAALQEVVEGQRAADRAIGEILELVGVVVDTMPASAEGSNVDVAGMLGDLQASVAKLAAVPSRSEPTAFDAAAVAQIADAVVDRLDLDALAALVAEHLSTGFEVVAEPPADPAPPARKARKSR